MGEWYTGSSNGGNSYWIPKSQIILEDKHIWRFHTSGIYTAKSAYEGFFQGSVEFSPWQRIWKSWAPNKCRFFMWHVAHNKCWTADHLARRGLQHHPKCLLCDQEEETLNHLLVICVFAREFWFELLLSWNEDLAPRLDESCFDYWWARSSIRLDGLIRHGFYFIIILGAWLLWNHRNLCVFYSLQPWRSLTYGT
jgi:hypothetical protein